MTLEDIRARYPHPVACHDDNPDEPDEESYCVGGALCLMAPQALSRPLERFPTSGTLAYVLRKVNPALMPYNSIRYAEIITIRNDQGRTEDAWRALGRALKATR